MNKNYTAVESPATKVTITISRQTLWNNYISVWSELAWDNRDVSLADLRDVMCVLVKDVPLSSPSQMLALRDLFRKGHSVALLGDAMTEIDKDDVLQEIHVTDGPSCVMIIRHEDINY
jgi:hypothetical protein